MAQLIYSWAWFSCSTGDIPPNFGRDDMENARKCIEYHCMHGSYRWYGTLIRDAQISNIYNAEDCGHILELHQLYHILVFP